MVPLSPHGPSVQPPCDVQYLLVMRRVPESGEMLGVDSGNLGVDSGTRWNSWWNIESWLVNASAEFGVIARRLQRLDLLERL